jgi:hypothetical protein
MIEKESMIKTEQRIVCFADVLGFKEMIDEYDSGKSLDILERI